MKILNLIRERLTARHADAHSAYWAHIEKIASGELSERAAASAADSIEKLLPALNKSLDDVERDIADVTALHEVEADAQRRDVARRALKDTARAGVAIEERARKLEDEARVLREEHANRMAGARAAVAATDGAEARIADLRRRLAAGGHPGFAGEADRVARQREIERIEAELRGMTDTLRERAAEVAALPVTDANQVEADRAARARGRLALLEERHARLVARLESLRNGGPIDVEGNTDDDDFDDAEPLAEEVGRG